MRSGAIPGARISFRASDGEGWLELLASGLTFDLTGLAPAGPAVRIAANHRFGLGAEIAGEPLEAIALSPGPHIAAGRAIMPVVRTMAGLASLLVNLPLPVSAVCWHPARCWMEPGYFTRIVQGWLEGGAFPALGLTAVERAADGAIDSVGLHFFAGQEVRVEPQGGEPSSETVKLAVRMIDHIVRHGPILAPQDLEGPAGERLLAEPSRDGRLVRVRRSAA